MTYLEALTIAAVFTAVVFAMFFIGFMGNWCIQVLWERSMPAGIMAVVIGVISALSLVIWTLNHLTAEG